MNTTMSFWDIGIILFYFAIIIWIAKWASKGNKEKSASDYFLAGKNQGWLVVGASLFASNIGSEIILGVSGAGARANMPMANFEIIAALVLILLGWVFVPFYLRTGVYTMPEFLEKRYSKACRNYLSVVSVLAYVITKISLIIFAGALVFETIGVPFWTGAIITVIATGFYTVLGGLKAVIYTDMVQAVVLLLGTIAVTIFGVYQLGGWDGLIWYWCTDQYIVQRTLSAKDVTNARRGALFAGYLKLLPVFIFFIPGVIAYALLQKGEINFVLENADQALPTMINSFLPIGLKGLAIAGLLAALMSSLSSAFNSSSTLLTIDFYKQYKPNASDKSLVRFGQLATIILVIVSLGWIPFMRALMGGGIFHYLQSVQAYISPPIAAVFLFGLFYKWINAKGAIIALWSGFVLGIFRLVTEFMSNEGVLSVEKGSLLSYFLEINFLHFALVLFLFCALVLAVGSRFGKSKTESELAMVTFQKTNRGSSIVWSKDATLTVLLIVFVLVLWALFSPLGLAS